MRIFYASDRTPNPAFQSNLWRDNLYRPLVDLGHEVIEFDYDLRETFQYLDTRHAPHQKFIRNNRPKVTAGLLCQIKTAHAIKPIDVFFSYFYDACVLPEALDEIRAMGIATVNWFCNGSYQLYLVQEISRHYDWCLVPEKFRLPDYVAMGARPLYCQEAANPNIYKPYDLPQEFDVSFVGQAYGERPAYIKYLRDQDINVRAWGQGWPGQSETARRGGKMRSLLGAAGARAFAQRLLGRRPIPQETPVTLPSEAVGPSLSDLDMIQMYSRSKINLGFSTCGSTHLGPERIVQVRLRDFEVPMSGGFYMVEYMQELEEFFKVGKEVVCYQGPQDLADKIHYYLTHNDEREQIRWAGHARCLRDHSWHQRFKTAFAQMGLA